MSSGNGAEAPEKEKLVLMWGYLPGATPERAPLLSPTSVRLPPSTPGGDSWKDVYGGGCGFAMATTVNGKLITWGSTDELGQSYLTSGKHEEIPLAFPLPKGTCIVKASAGWAHCSAITSHGEVYTWGWKECVPSGRSTGDPSPGEAVEKEPFEGLLFDQVSPRSRVSKASTSVVSNFDGEVAEDSSKRRRLSTAKQSLDSLPAVDEIISAAPCLVTFGTGVKIMSAAAGGRHALALSDAGQVWGWGYGGEGQLGLGARIRIVNSPHPIPCVDSSMYGKDRSRSMPKGMATSEGWIPKGTGSCVKAIACGGRHSVAVTDNGTLLTFGWGLYGQCGQGNTEDGLSPTCVPSLIGTQIQGIAAGLWHTVCTSVDGSIYAFGGNQFGQLGTASDQLELVPKQLNPGCLAQKKAKIVSCGARHTAMLTEDGEVFCWGWNKYGQLGLGDTGDRSIPSLVPLKSFFPKNICCGWWHTVLLAESST